LLTKTLNQELHSFPAPVTCYLWDQIGYLVPTTAALPYQFKLGDQIIIAWVGWPCRHRGFKATGL